MWFECSECGGHLHRAAAPAVCPECGLAGAIFVRADPDELTTGDTDGDDLRATWLRAGLEQPDVFTQA